MRVGPSARGQALELGQQVYVFKRAGTGVSRKSRDRGKTRQPALTGRSARVITACDVESGEFSLTSPFGRLLSRDVT